MHLNKNKNKNKICQSEPLDHLEWMKNLNILGIDPQESSFYNKTNL